MKRFTLLLLLIFILSFPAAAQDEPEKLEVKCPAISVTGPSAAVRSGEPGVFTVSVIGDHDREKLEIKWSVDKGEIISGQGTNTLEVSFPMDDTELTATVTVKAGEGCEMTASETGVPAIEPVPRLTDEYGNITDEDIWARTDAFMVELQNEPDATGYIVIYGPDRQLKAREKLLRDYVRNRRFDASRILYVIGGREDRIRTRIWLAPAGADLSVID